MLLNSQIEVRHRQLDNNGDWGIITNLNYTLAPQANVTLAIEVTPFAAGIRQVQVKILDVNGIYQLVPGGPLDIPASMSLSDNAYYISMVHDSFNSSFTASGSINIHLGWFLDYSR